MCKTEYDIGDEGRQYEKDITGHYMPDIGNLTQITVLQYRAGTL